MHLRFHKYVDFFWQLRFHNAEVVLRKHNSRLTAHRIKLILLLPPLRIVNAIDPLLRLNHDTPILRHGRVAPRRSMLLALLDGDVVFLRDIVARVDLQALLIRVDVQLDARDVAAHGEHAQVRGFGRRVPRSVEDEGVVVARAAEAAGVDGLLDVLADGFGGGEVEEGACCRADAAIGDFDIVDFDVSRGVGHVECVVEDGVVIWVVERVEVPIDVVGQHYGSGLVEWNRYQSASPCRSRWG